MLDESQQSSSEGADMERDDITRSQAAVIAKSLQPSLRCLFRLRQRVEKVGCAASDRY